MNSIENEWRRIRAAFQIQELDGARSCAIRSKTDNAIRDRGQAKKIGPRLHAGSWVGLQASSIGIDDKYACETLPVRYVSDPTIRQKDRQRVIALSLRDLSLS